VSVCPCDVTTSKIDTGMDRFFNTKSLDRYRKLASNAIDVVERCEIIEALAHEFNTFKRETRATAVKRRRLSADDFVS
jgi:hypothetical protein